MANVGVPGLYVQWRGSEIAFRRRGPGEPRGTARRQTLGRQSMKLDAKRWVSEVAFRRQTLGSRGEQPDGKHWGCQSMKLNGKR